MRERIEKHRSGVLVCAAAVGLAVSGCGDGSRRTPATPAAVPTVTAAKKAPGSARRSRTRSLGIYAAEAPSRLSSRLRRVPARVYVPNSLDSTVSVVDQRTFKVIDTFPTGAGPNHVTPSADLRRLWVDNTAGGSLTPIDPMTGRPGRRVTVRDPYNLYYAPRSGRAIVVAEALRSLDFRSARSMRLRDTLAVPSCAGVNHMDFTADGRRALISCEFGSGMIVVDMVRRRVLKRIAMPPGSKPQDVKLSPDGRTFYVADLIAGGVWKFSARKMRRTGFLRTGAGAHGLYPSRDARVLYVSNRGAGSISQISFASKRVVGRWRLPGGGSPDMGGLSASGRVLWLSGRYSSVIYAISTRSGRLLARIPVGNGPHGMAVWPQPGRTSLGHTGNLR